MISILYLRMALYLRPDLGLAQILLADRFESLHKFDYAIAIYHGIEPSLALFPHGADPGGAGRAAAGQE